MEKAPKKNNSKLKLVMAVMVTAALFIAELYVIINQSNNMVLVIGIAVFILIALYFVIDAILDCVNKNNIANKEQYDNIYKSSKASYMLLKKNLDELSKQVKSLNDGNDKNEAGSAEIIKSQKVIARVAMSKNKDAQDRLFVELNNLEASLNDSICGLSEKLSGFQEEIERLADHIARINEEAILTASKSSQEFEPAVEEESVIFEDVLNDSFEEETVLKESEVDVVSELEELDSLFVDSIDDVVKYVSSDRLRNLLVKCKNDHESLMSKTQEMLDDYQDEGKNPNPLVKGMSWIKTNMRLIVNESDETIADLMTDGCNMGVKSLSKYLNEYQAADEKSKNIVKDLIRIEEDLVKNIRYFL